VPKSELRSKTEYTIAFTLDTGITTASVSNFGFFLERLSIAQWERMEVRLRKEVKWYVDLSYDGVDDLISLTISIG
jgi:hypothetical protein